MDKVQIYFLAIIILNVVLALFLDGKPRNDSHYKFTNTFVGMLLSLPVYGRIFGWW